jgi:hypothetical protein
LRRKKRVQISRRGKSLAILRARRLLKETGGNRKNRKDGQRPSDGPQNGTGLNLDETSECLRTEENHRIIEGMNISSESGDFAITKVG